MGGKGVLKKREEKGQKKASKIANSKTDGRLGGNSQILKAGEALFKNFRTILRRSHNVNKSE